MILVWSIPPRVKEKQEEFKNDLLDKYGFLEHPKADKIFLLAWQAGSGKYSDVEMYFSDFLGLFDCLSPDDLNSIVFKLWLEEKSTEHQVRNKKFLT